MNPFLKIAVEAGPLIVFFAAYTWGDIFVATAAFMIAVIAALTVSWMVERRIPMVPLFTAVVVIVFGGLTLWFSDETFVKMKPTIINAAFALTLLSGLVLDRPLLKPLFDSVFQLDDQGWRILTWRWTLFFAAMAVLNEIVWRSFSTDVWVNVKVFGYLPLTLVFSMLQMPLIQRHGLGEEAKPAD